MHPLFTVFFYIPGGCLGFPPSTVPFHFFYYTSTGKMLIPVACDTICTVESMTSILAPCTMLDSQVHGMVRSTTSASNQGGSGQWVGSVVWWQMDLEVEDEVPSLELPSRSWTARSYPLKNDATGRWSGSHWEPVTFQGRTVKFRG